MANNCSNWARFTGDQNKLNELAKFLQEWLIDKYDELPNHTLLDIPVKEWNESEKKDVYVAFGTKWIDVNEIRNENDGELILNADTAWAPFNPFIKNLCEKFNVNCENEYEEPGCCIYGSYTIDDGDAYNNEMCKGEWYASSNPDGIEEELEFFDKEDYKHIKHLLTEEQKKIVKNSDCFV